VIDQVGFGEPCDTRLHLVREGEAVAVCGVAWSTVARPLTMTDPVVAVTCDDCLAVAASEIGYYIIQELREEEAALIRAGYLPTDPNDCPPAGEPPF
jgi:hypothetical protein